ncbi:receptor-like protein kinase FERONIA [Cynara cardunculus var. scolymus]|uniref:receptor-like protein kinase FERONIA n=1 Tax=Cynara cardunculus var. scolymus TaxID=59895 RepID=UPI000D62799A|nr:receptor-like protein kinase FERONIA [Cynara cardunculus var. scolymus]
MSSTTGEADKFSSLTSTHVCYHFSLDEIQFATNDFDDEVVIGRGGFGKVYKGSICIGETSHVVAIKRLDSMSDQGALEFRNEIEMLSKLRHCHLVSLIGFCDDNKEMILVYEYMPHGTLDHHLHKADTPLNWVQRLKIALGAARGLDYLHTGVATQHGVIHRDIKSSNILLDENWAAMISDIGLSKVGPTNQSFSDFDISASVKGTFGYLDPKYFYTRRVTRKTDVFAFGVVLFELLSGRRAVDARYGEEQCSLVRWAKICVKDRKLYQLVDYNIRGTIFAKCLKRYAQIAYRCVDSVLKERPSMTEVVASLQLLLELQEKHDNSTESSGKVRFAWKIHKYLVPTAKQNYDQSGSSSSQKSLENHMNLPSSINKGESNHGETMEVATDIKKFTYVELECATRNFGTVALLVNEDEDVSEVFEGSDETGLPIAVKRFRNDEHGSLKTVEYNI